MDRNRPPPPSPHSRTEQREPEEKASSACAGLQAARAGATGAPSRAALGLPSLPGLSPKRPLICLKARVCGVAAETRPGGREPSAQGPGRRVRQAPTRAGTAPWKPSPKAEPLRVDGAPCTLPAGKALADRGHGPGHVSSAPRGAGGWAGGRGSSAAVATEAEGPGVAALKLSRE